MRLIFGNSPCHAVLVTAFTLALTAIPAHADKTPPTPSSAQPVVPPGAGAATSGSPLVETIVGRPRPKLVVRKQAERSRLFGRYYARRRQVPVDVERPALAGVEVLAPLPPPAEPPHIVVPMPEYPLDAIIAPFLTPPPPVVCHHTRRVRDVPDPNLYREVTLDCLPDNP